jgi:7-cyano-7-deazaguanine reductase
MPESKKSRTVEEMSGVTLLGNNNTKYSCDYSPEVLETFVNKHPDNDYVVTFDAYEFTSKCPKTGQPDFAKVVISYIPNERMVESKSLKLYLFSFREHGDFHEDCMNIIMKDLIKLMDPKYIEVKGIFSPRGGISIFPFVNYANPKFNYQDFSKSRMLDALRDASNRKVRYDM